MPTTPEDVFDAAIRDGADLAPWTAANRVAAEDARLEVAVLRGLGGLVPPDAAMGVPLLRFANTDLPAVPLVQAVIAPPQHRHDTCDRCGLTGRTCDRLWVRAGASVVEVACCWRCRVALDMPHRGGSTLVWS